MQAGIDLDGNGRKILLLDSERNLASLMQDGNVVCQDVAHELEKRVPEIVISDTYDIPEECCLFDLKQDRQIPKQYGPLRRKRW